MKKKTVLVTLGISIAGVVLAYVVPHIGKGKNEVLVRTWTETEKIVEEPEVDTMESETGGDDKKKDSQNKKTKNEKLSSTEASSVSSNAVKIAEPKESKKKENTTKVKKVTKQEKMKARPLKFSRAVQFRPEDIEVVKIDTVDIAETSLEKDSI